jgi:phospholipid/cholesterol/gamma-HCH transport system ATP-binding protein
MPFMPMPDRLPVAVAKNLTVQYGDRRILADISSTVLSSEIRVILGASGCGKTTLLKAMIGLLKPAAGKVWLFDTEITDQDDPATMAVLKKVGVLFQNGALLGSLTVEDNVMLPLQMHTRLGDRLMREIVAYKLAQVNLPDAGPLYPSELSGGMRKRAALARALALDPPLVFCDEPSAGLDPVTSAGLDELLLELRASLGITIVVVTHELRSIERIADNISFLHGGSLMFEGPLREARALEGGPVHAFFSRQESGALQAAGAPVDFFVEKAP